LASGALALQINSAVIDRHYRRRFSIVDLLIGAYVLGKQAFREADSFPYKKLEDLL